MFHCMQQLALLAPFTPPPWSKHLARLLILSSSPPSTMNPSSTHERSATPATAASNAVHASPGLSTANRNDAASNPSQSKEATTTLYQSESQRDGRDYTALSAVATDDSPSNNPDADRTEITVPCDTASPGAVTETRAEVSTGTTPPSVSPSPGAVGTTPAQRRTRNTNEDATATHPIEAQQPQTGTHTSNVTTPQRPRCVTAIRRVLGGKQLGVPDADVRLSQQLKYIENVNVPPLASLTTEFIKLFMQVLNLQVKLPQSVRLHLLMESDLPPSSSNSIESMDLYNLFSPTICTDSNPRADSISAFGTVLAQFKLYCANDSKHHSMPLPMTEPTTRQLPQDSSQQRSVPNSVPERTEPNHSHTDADPNPTPPTQGTVQCTIEHSTAEHGNAVVVQQDNELQQHLATHSAVRKMRTHMLTETTYIYTQPLSVLIKTAMRIPLKLMTTMISPSLQRKQYCN